MGYRSDVGLAMYKDDFDKMIRTAAEENLDLTDLFRCAGVYQHDSGVVTVYWEYVKWYEEFNDVCFVMEYIGKIASLFIRMGESSDDEIEVRYGNDDDSIDFDEYMYPIREIYVDTSGKPVRVEEVMAIAATDGSDMSGIDAGSLEDLFETGA